MKFLRNLLASIFGSFIAMGILFFLFLIIVAALGDSEKVVVKNNSVLVIDMDRMVKDYAPNSDDPIDELLGINDRRLGLNEIINAIENAKTDPNILGISINTIFVSTGLSQTQSIRKKLEEFKATGKFVQAYSYLYDQSSYYLSSVADSIFMNPQGMVDFKGLSSEVLFFKDFEDQTGIKMEVVRHGKYKSAVEPFIASEMSADNRLQITSFLESIWGSMLNDMANSRNVDIDQLNTIADNALGRNAKLAKEHKLIDGIKFADEYQEYLADLVDVSSESLHSISLANYIASGKGRSKQTSTDRIAVIYAQGEIIYGRGDEDFIGQDLIIKALKSARKSSSVKGIVLRVNSPGGSAIASELIWREIELTRKELPLVVSMGDYAASGGYYLACNAEKIFAEPTTITGSIGVFGTIPNVSGLAEDIGINAEQVHTNKGPYYSLFEPMSEEFRAFAVQGVEQVYDTFLIRVSEGRGMSIEEVDAVAQGRVWSGTEAVENGLVDELGGLEDAIAYTAELAGVDTYRVRNYPSYKVELEDRFSVFPFVKSKEEIIKEEFGEAYLELYRSLKTFGSQRGVQARIPFLMKIE